MPVKNKIETVMYLLNLVVWHELTHCEILPHPIMRLTEIKWPNM